MHTIPTRAEVAAMTDSEHKLLENQLRREAQCKGFLLRRNRTRDRSAENYGLYVLIGDSRGNRLPGAAAAPNAFWRGEGDTLEGIAAELANCRCTSRPAQPRRRCR
jgi:hypothetical protein